MENFLKNSKLCEIKSLIFYRWNRHVSLSHAAADMAFVTAHDCQTRLSTPGAFSDPNIFRFESECPAHLTSCPARCLAPYRGAVSQIRKQDSSYGHKIHWRFKRLCVRFWALFAKLRKATVSFVRSVCLSEWNNSSLTGRIFMKFCIWVSLENLPRKFEFH